MLYVNLPGFGNEQVVTDFQRIFPQVRKARGLILDVRQKVGGNAGHGYAIISRLINHPIERSHWKTRQYLPALRAWGQKEQWHGEKDDVIPPNGETPFLGLIAILTGPRTETAAEDFVVALLASKRATVIGERTARSTGQPLVIDLPGRGRTRICTKRDTYPDGREFVGVGIVPDMEVHLMGAELAAGRDIILEKAIQILAP